MTVASGDFPPLIRWHVHPDAAALAGPVCTRILAVARQAIAERGVFHIVLAGGNTPATVYRSLARHQEDWRNWQVYFGDERCLPVDDPERNSVMARDAWLGQVDIPESNVHVIPAERGAAKAAQAYASVIAAARPFDVVLLGMGEDGHTASLFPGQPHDGCEPVHAVHHAPKPPADRVSLGECVLNDAQVVLVLITGGAKHAAVARWKAGADLPVAHLHGRAGVDVYLDAAADCGVATD